MSRSVSTSFLSAVNVQETDEVFLILLQIDHSTLGSPIRLVNNMVDIVSNGFSFIGYPFAISLPDDIEDQLPSVNMTIDNVDRQIVAAVRTISSPATISMSLILASDPNTIEVGPIEMTLREVKYNALHVTGTLQPADLLNEMFPVDQFTPGKYPGLH